MKCLKLIFCLLCLCCSLAEAKGGQVDAQKEVDEITGRLVASYLEVKVDEDIIAGYATALRADGSFPDLDYVTVHEGSFYPAGSHLKRLKSMAVAYRKPGNKYYNSGKLLKQIVAGIDYWYKVIQKLVVR